MLNVESHRMVRKGLNTVYLTDKEAEVIDRYIQLNFMKLKKKRKAGSVTSSIDESVS